MTDRAVFLLDPAGDAILPGNVTLLSTERAFFEKMTHPDFDTSCYVIRGRALCKWAEDWSEGRGLTVERLVSPRDAWRGLHLLWTDDEIAWLQKQLGHAMPPGNADATLQTFYPKAPWQGIVGPEHAARWALFLQEAQITDAIPLHNLLTVPLSRWRSDSDDIPFFREAYTLDTAEKAVGFLRDWILEGRYLPTFPLPLPDFWTNKAEETWRYAPRDQGPAGFWANISAKAIPPEIRRVAGQLIFRHLKRNAAQITRELLIALRTSLSEEQSRELSEIHPPNRPGRFPLDASSSKVLDWILEEYLPFRQWQSHYGGADDLACIEAAASSFADWRVQTYPQDIAGGSGYNSLTVSAAARLQSRKSGVLLWIILDGMTPFDGERLLEMLATDTRLSPAEHRYLFTVLPTITRFCKPALMNGRPPDLLDITETPTPDFAGARLLRDKSMRKDAAAAQSGETLILSLKEPDATYHSNKSRQTIAAEVEARLNAITSQIKELCELVPEAHELTLLVTTDHGRLLSDNVERTHALPVRAEATTEGRAAWGNLPDNSPPGIVALSAERYRLPAGVTAWVARDADAFLQSNGAHGAISFPHGGLWPEEVVVPWFTFVRDVRPPVLRIRATGSGRSGGTGSMTLTFTSADTVSLTVREVRLRSLSSNWNWEESKERIIDQQAEQMISYEVPSWPSEQANANITGEATILLPSGVTFTLPVDVELTSDALFRTSLDADDLFEL